MAPMAVSLSGGEGLPEHCFVSMRVGEVRKLGHYKEGETFRFDVKEMPRYVVLDVFEKVGTTRLALKDCALSGPGSDFDVTIESSIDATRKMHLKMKVDTDPSLAEKAVPRSQDTDWAKSYLDSHQVVGLLQGMVHVLLRDKPEDALAFMAAYLKEKKSSAAGADPPTPSAPPAAAAVASMKMEVHLEDIPGLGEEDYPGFPADTCPEVLPDLAKHKNILAEVLRNDPSIYATLRSSRTPGGVTLSRCIKPGIDTLGNAMIKTVGAVAGDMESYETFAPLFDAVVSKLHPRHDLSKGHPTSTLADALAAAAAAAPLDPGRVVGVRVRCRRNLRALPMSPAATPQQRVEVERVLARALGGLPAGAGAGEYFPLSASRSYGPKPRGMGGEDAERLESEGLLFRHPDSVLQLSSGVGRCWPEARGVFVGADGIGAWLNEDDHLQLMAWSKGSNLSAAFARFCEVEAALSASLKANGHEFAHSARLGYLSTCPSHLGTGMEACAMVRLPQLGASTVFRRLCARLKVHARRATGTSENGIWEVSNLERLGSSEVDQVGAVLEGVRTLLAAEDRLASGEEINVEDFIAS